MKLSEKQAIYLLGVASDIAQGVFFSKEAKDQIIKFVHGILQQQDDTLVEFGKLEEVK